MFIPVNEVPNIEDLLSYKSDDLEKVRESVGLLPKNPEEDDKSTKDKFQASRYSNENIRKDVDFVWGFLFVDFPIIYVDGNHLYFRGEVHKESVNEIKRFLIDMRGCVTKNYFNIGVHNPKEMAIYLHINSPGGSMSDGFDLIDFMENFPIPIYTVGTGTVASMAVSILIAGKKRYITPNTHILVHQFRTGIVGKHQDILDYMKHLENIYKQLVSFISSKTKLSVDETKEMLKSESWFTAKDAIKMGFADEMYNL